MNAQFKKGVLELMVLAAVSSRDMYGYELVAEVSRGGQCEGGDYLSYLETSDQRALF